MGAYTEVDYVLLIGFEDGDAVTALEEVGTTGAPPKGALYDREWFFGKISSVFNFGRNLAIDFPVGRKILDKPYACFGSKGNILSI